MNMKELKEAAEAMRSYCVIRNPDSPTAVRLSNNGHKMLLGLAKHVLSELDGSPITEAWLRENGATEDVEYEYPFKVLVIQGVKGMFSVGDDGIYYMVDDGAFIFAIKKVEDIGTARSMLRVFGGVE